VSPPCFGSPAAGRFGPFAASLKHHIDGAFVLANAHLPDSQTSVSSFSAAVSPFNAHSSRSVRGGLVQHVFSLPSRWLSPCPSRYRPVCRAAKLKTLCVQAKNALRYLEPVFMLGGRSASQRSPVMAASGTRHNSRRRVAIRRRVGERHADSTANIVER
jgi:hypothetical protein